MLTEPQKTQKIFPAHSILCMVQTWSDRALDTQRMILESALAEIELNGILGLRIAEVAKNARCSMTQIYRYFGSRDGLLAQVLGDVYEEILHQATDQYMARIMKLPTLTIDDLVDTLPSIFDPGVQRRQELRLQVLATSVTNQQLKSRLSTITQEQFNLWSRNLDAIEARLADGVRLDRRVFTMAIATSLPYYRILLGEVGYTNAEYRQFLKDKLVLTTV